MCSFISFYVLNFVEAYGFVLRPFLSRLINILLLSVLVILQLMKIVLYSTMNLN